MRTLAFLTAAAIGTFGVAQSPLLHQAGLSNNTGNVGGAVYFNLTVKPGTNVTITQVDMNTNTAVGTVGTATLYMGPPTWVGANANAGLWTAVATGPITAAAVDTPTPCIFNTPITLCPGTYGMTWVPTGTNNRYTNGTGSNTTWQNNELIFAGGGASNSPFLLPLFSPRIANVSFHYTTGAPASQCLNVAAWSTYGAGCYKFSRTFYESMGSTATNQDLAGTDIVCAPAAGGYVVTQRNPGTAQFPAGTGAITQTLALTDDSAVVYGPLTNPVFFASGSPATPTLATHIEVGSNGTVTFMSNPGAPTNGGSSVVTVANFLNGAPRFGNWHDMDPGVGGQVTVDEDTTNLETHITFTNVPDWNIAGSSNTFQMTLKATGDMEIRYGSMSLLGGGGWPTIVGYTPGGGAYDPGTTDLSVALAGGNAITTQNTDNPPLALASDARPVLGNTINLLTSSIPVPATILGANMLSFQQQNVNLAGVGANNCFALVGAGVPPGATIIIPGVWFTLGNPQVSSPFTVPNNPGLNGVQIFAQSLSFTAGQNPIGILTSNGVRLFVGSL